MVQKLGQQHPLHHSKYILVQSLNWSKTLIMNEISKESSNKKWISNNKKNCTERESSKTFLEPSLVCGYKRDLYGHETSTVSTIKSAIRWESNQVSVAMLLGSIFYVGSKSSSGIG